MKPLLVFREHEEYGFCQVGVSSSLLKDDTLLLGSPGPYAWRGTIFTHDVQDNLLDRDSIAYMAPVVDGVSPVEKYSYLGMSPSHFNCCNFQIPHSDKFVVFFFVISNTYVHISRLIH